MLRRKLRWKLGGAVALNNGGVGVSVETAPDLFQVLTARYLVLARFNHTNLFSFTAHVRSLTPFHYVEHGLGKCFDVDWVGVGRFRDFAVHDSVFEFDTEGWSDTHTRHLLNINTLFQLLEHARLQEVDLMLILLLQGLNQLVPRVGQL